MTRTGRPKALPYLVLHHEEFTRPQLLPECAGELLPHRFTHHPSKKAGLFSVALVVTGFRRCPDVIRLAALRCSDFPLPQWEKRLPGLLLLHGSRSITKNVEHWNMRELKEITADAVSRAAYRDASNFQ